MSKAQLISSALLEPRTELWLEARFTQQKANNKRPTRWKDNWCHHHRVGLHLFSLQAAERQTEWCCVFSRYCRSVVSGCGISFVQMLMSRWCRDRYNTINGPAGEQRFFGIFHYGSRSTNCLLRDQYRAHVFRMNWTTAIYRMASTNSPRNVVLGTRSDCDLFNKRDLSWFPAFRSAATKVMNWNAIHGGGAWIGFGDELMIGLDLVWAFTVQL